MDTLLFLLVTLLIAALMAVVVYYVTRLVPFLNDNAARLFAFVAFIITILVRLGAL